MPKRRIVFANQEFYHLYNRSTGGITIFEGKRTLDRILSLTNYYRYPQPLRFSKFQLLSREERISYETSFRKEKPLLEILAFSFMPNHYHFLLKQLGDGGILKFISNFQNSFAKYFNTKTDRHGVVFQGPFRAKYIEKENYLLHLLRYIHLNPVTSYLVDVKELDSYPWTSFPIYLKKELNTDRLINTRFIENIIGSKEKLKKFVYNQADYQRNLRKIKDLLLEKL